MPRSRRIPARLTFEPVATKPKNKKPVVVHRLVTDKDRAAAAVASSSSSAAAAAAAPAAKKERAMVYINPAFYMHGIMSVPVDLCGQQMVVVIEKMPDSSLLIRVVNASQYTYVSDPIVGMVWIWKQENGTYAQKAADGYKVKLNFNSQSGPDHVQFVFDDGTTRSRCMTIPRECIDRVEYDQVKPALNK